MQQTLMKLRVKAVITTNHPSPHHPPNSSILGSIDSRGLEVAPRDAVDELDSKGRRSGVRKKMEVRPDAAYQVEALANNDRRQFYDEEQVDRTQQTDKHCHRDWWMNSFIDEHSFISATLPLG